MAEDKQLTSIAGKFQGKDILSLSQFSPQDIAKLFTVAAEMAKLVEKSEAAHILAGTITTLLFFEPSSRTFGSFSASVKRLGGGTVELSGMHSTSVAKGETLEDTINTFASYSNVLVMRHPQPGSVQIAAHTTTIPVINAGDGIGEHPTQALLDLYTIYEKLGTLDNLTCLLAGDILNGRTVHSLMRGLSLYKNNTVYLLSPKKLKLTKEDFATFTARGLKLFEIEKETDIPPADVWYWTRVQKERFADLTEYEKIKHAFIVTPELLKKYAKKKTLLMHPLPRIGEITTDVDSDPRAMYLKYQMRNGMYVRMALLGLVLERI